MIAMKDREFTDLVTYMKQHFGINLTQKRALMEGRLSLRIQEKGFDNYGDYFNHVLQDKSGQEVNNLINILTTNHTFFLRENQHFDFLKKTALPYFETQLHDRDLRTWSAGCSSGEEAYTIAMIYNEYFGMNKTKWDTTILATDISTKVLEAGKNAVYQASALQSVPETWVKKYFTALTNEQYQIRSDLRKEVLFRSLNLMQTEFPFKKKFHIIFCRNVMIYFDGPTKKALIQRYYDMTEPGGYLFIGHAESIGRGESDYEYVQPAIFRKPLHSAR